MREKESAINIHGRRELDYIINLRHQVPDGERVVWGRRRRRLAHVY